ncbi:Hepatocyte cell adhesion molecule [Varanus komodoensis]|nr:Hepatocyte cell adhesion molecule [Varanus komodoensis]
MEGGVLGHRSIRSFLRSSCRDISGGSAPSRLPGTPGRSRSGSGSGAAPGPSRHQLGGEFGGCDDSRK